MLRDEINYVVLEYAQSDLDPRGEQFLIIVWYDLDNSPIVKLCLLESWDLLIPSDRDEDKVYIEDFIFEVRQQQFRKPDTTGGFFQGIQRLNMGPIRTSVAGSMARGQAELAWPESPTAQEDLSLCDGSLFLTLSAAMCHNSDPETVFPVDHIIS